MALLTLSIYPLQQGEIFPKGFLSIDEGDNQEFYGWLKDEDWSGTSFDEILRWKVKQDKIEKLKEILEEEFGSKYALDIFSVHGMLSRLAGEMLISEDAANDLRNYPNK